jgi:RNA polymerase sigma factor (sigma-70 family)
MSSGRLSSVVQYLRQIAGTGDAGEQADCQLLERFVTKHDESAYEALMRRHAPMVLGTCSRILRNGHDAEDAFQATFLVLARKARSIGQRRSVGGWLHRIACRTAARARGKVARRRARERPLGDVLATDVTGTCDWHDLRPVIDEELNRLPERYRMLIVLCYFEEKTYAEAAQLLGLAEGTVSSRLARARGILRARLSRRGLGLSSAGLAIVLPQNVSPASMPAGLVDATAKAAVQFAAGKAAAISAQVGALTESVLRAMFLSSIRTATAVVLTLGLIGSGVGVAAHWGRADPQANPLPGNAVRLPPQQAAKTTSDKPSPPSKFENAFGYSWAIEPSDVSANLVGLQLDGFHAILGKSVGVMVDVTKSGTLALTVADGHAAGAADREYRPVVLDAERKRYLPNSNGGGASATLSLIRYYLSPETLPLHKVRYLGIECLTAEGRRAIATRAAQRARAAGVEVLPKAQPGNAYDFTLTLIEGKKVRARDLRGKVVLIDCWSTTCSPCMKKMPALKRLYEKYHKEGFEIIGVSFDNDAKTVEKACQSHGLTWPQSLVPADESTRALWYEAAGMGSVPRILLIDRNGILRADCSPHELEAQIVKLMESSFMR